MEKKDISYEYFKNEDILIYGKYREYVDALWTHNKIQESLFERLVDLYAVAAVIGLRIGRKLPNDSSGEKRTIPLSVISGEYIRLRNIMQVILILDESRALSEEDRIKMAFDNMPKDKETYTANMELFHSYARGGLEYLYQELILRPTDIDDMYTDSRIANIIALVNNPLVKDVEQI